MILLRTHLVDRPLAEFADQLAVFSGMPVTYLVDEGAGPVAVPAPHGKVGLTRAACRALGLHCPADFAWRCGDYGLYLARRQFPQVDRFWMIEHDVRLAGTRPAALFEAFAGDPADLLATYVEPAPASWYWSSALESRDRPVAKCFFPVVRLTARAIDTMLADRQRHSRRPSRRMFWANDEGFVATSVAGAGYAWRDLNAPGAVFYTHDRFAFDTLSDAAALPAASAEVRLLHPVLAGAALETKRARLAQREPRTGLAARIGKAVQRRVGMRALVGACNRRQAW